jgi:hypothetical protein
VRECDCIRVNRANGSERHGWQGSGLTPENRERWVRSHNWSKTNEILMVLTSHDQLGNTGRKTGFWLEEFAAPYFVFKDAGVELTLASPKGGQPPLAAVALLVAFRRRTFVRGEGLIEGTGKLH